MRSRSFLAFCAVLVALLTAAGAVYAYDAGRDDLIAKGVSIGGVDVGGLRAHQARERLQERILLPLNQPVVARYKGRSYTLTAEQARLGVDLEGSVHAALGRSRSGDLFTRAFRGITGAQVRADVPIRITHDENVVRELVDRVSGELDRPARDAEVDLSKGRIDRTTSHTGLQVRAARLERELNAALTSVGGERAIRVHARTVQPKVTTEELAGRYPAVLMVNRGSFRLTLYKNLKPAKTYRIAVGAAGLETPAGLYHIQNKQKDPAWHVPDSDWAGKLRGKVIAPDDPKNPIKARWMGIYDGAGIHGTTAVDSLGSAASHGCIRMAIPDVIELFDEVPVQAPVYIS
jgi:lipoprotein-anchoring transpeptidase ErfK/SrfK